MRGGRAHTFVENIKLRVMTKSESLDIADFNSLQCLLLISAVGCTNLIPPEDAWIKREDDKIIIGCYTSRQTWQLRCHDGRWTGVVSNCSQGVTLWCCSPCNVYRIIHCRRFFHCTEFHRYFIFIYLFI